MEFSNLTSSILNKELVKLWLLEDIPNFDVGGYVVGDDITEAHIFFKSNGVFSGKPYAQAVFDLLGVNVEWHFQEGVEIDCNGSKVLLGTVTGKCCDVLRAERTVLNILSRASGVATQSRKASNIAKEVGWNGVVAGTRKTTPGFRQIEKYSLIVGGCAPHRYDLSQMVMLKDNHIWKTGSITKAVQLAREAAGFAMKIEVECQNQAEALEAGESGADIVMLDNFSSNGLQEIVNTIKGRYPNLLIEISGGINDSNMREYMIPGVDIISRGSLTHGYSPIDISMKIKH